MSSHCERSPKSVEARNHRYLPLASHTGYIASARPSVTCFCSPVSTLAITIARIERVEPAGKRDPLRVGAPRRMQRALRHHPGIAADDLRLAGLDVHHPDVEVGVGVEQLLRIGRPRRRVVERRLVEGDFARRADAVLRFDHQLVFAGFVAEVRDPLAVGRPGRRALGGRARVGDVADVALLRRDGEDLAARFGDDPLAGRRRGRCCSSAP